MRIRNLLYVTGLSLMITACSSGKTSLTYFENIEKVNIESVKLPDYKITILPDDELFISVNSLIPSATMQYNLPLSNPAPRENIGDEMKSMTNPQYQTYIVDKDGDINFPSLGKIHVEGLTVEQLTDKLVKEISRDVVDPLVRVELLSFNVNVMGEVVKPGRYNVRQQRFSVLDALATAGDMTEFGERDNVVIIREVNGKPTYTKLNLNSAEIFNSPDFYLRQNDIVYVAPNKVRQDNSKYNQNNAFKLSLTSTIVSAVSVIASLVIALTVK